MGLDLSNQIFLLTTIILISWFLLIAFQSKLNIDISLIQGVEKAALFMLGALANALLTNRRRKK